MTTRRAALAAISVAALAAGAFPAFAQESKGTVGIAMPLDRFPDAVADALRLLPAGALSEGLRDVLRDGAATPWAALGVLLAWAAAAGAAAAATFRWE